MDLDDPGRVNQPAYPRQINRKSTLTSSTSQQSLITHWRERQYKYENYKYVVEIIVYRVKGGNKIVGSADTRPCNQQGESLR